MNNVQIVAGTKKEDDLAILSEKINKGCVDAGVPTPGEVWLLAYLADAEDEYRKMCHASWNYTVAIKKRGYAPTSIMRDLEQANTGFLRKLSLADLSQADVAVFRKLNNEQPLTVEQAHEFADTWLSEGLALLEGRGQGGQQTRGDEL